MATVVVVSSRGVQTRFPYVQSAWVRQTEHMIGFGRKRRDKKARTPKAVWSDWLKANDAGDAERAGQFAAEMTRVAPDSYYSWFEAALHAKARRDWPRSLEWNQRATELFGEAEASDFGGDNPAAWNLGIAATAVGDWATARRAWTMYGVAGLDDGAGPIHGNFGSAPIRLNPDRPTLSLQVVPEFGTTEVVWSRRRSPAHAVITSVPLPESGHRFGDVLLHDGEPKGTRWLDDVEVSVFDEIDKLQDSELGTWQAQVENATTDDFDALGEIAYRYELGADNWSGINVLCSACSHGSPDPQHSHQPAPDGTTMVGLGGIEGDISRCIEEWTDSRQGVRVLNVEFLW